MPRYVDHEVRKQAILDAALEIMANEGSDGLSFRRIAEMVGGNSTTVVTHYYATQRELLDDLHARLSDAWESQIASLDLISDSPQERLRQLILWFIPETDADITMERARIQLMAQTEVDEVFRLAYQRWNASMREHLRERLVPLAPAEQLDSLVDLLRIFTRGTVLSMLEYPGEWPSERRTAVVDRLICLIDQTTTNPALPH
ncbi:TetR/AcrR family transcriptional regulator [Fodinicola acaciae]|uniref:TetR/AcrR family transcriptional regulator n=1 Tax=Fodinicola acaciae TaxID=2681555 RepID=UPI0013D0CC36|nr:TetR/AcrR family transcriptional regulator [Fodinicola acaciae]